MAATVLIMCGFVAGGLVMTMPSPAGADALGPMVRMSANLSAPPAGSTDSGSVSSSQGMSGEVALTPPDPASLTSFVTAVSTPSSPSYRHYLSAGQFGSQFGASSTTVAAVSSWLESGGLHVTGVSSDNLFVRFSGTAGQVESTMGTQLRHFSAPGGRTGFATASPLALPQALGDSVTGVLGLDTVTKVRSNLVISKDAAKPAVASHATSIADVCGVPAWGAQISMSQLADAYGLENLYSGGRTGAGVTIGIYELEPYSPTDIEAGLSCGGSNASVTNVPVDGGAGAGNGSGEAALDIEMAGDEAPDSNILVYTGQNGSDAQDLDPYIAMADADKAQVVSSSWGICEPDADASLVEAENVVFEQMAAQGQTVLVASGDSGSSGCYEQDGTTRLAVDDPASQPYVTAVGGTTLLTSEVSPGSPPDEVAWNNCWNQPGLACAEYGDGGAGTGGVSENWAMPAWQQTELTAADRSAPSPCGSASGLCREVPDVSASANPEQSNDEVFYGGGWLGVGGTSAAAPLWAAAVALVDQGCANPVGFIDPLLYQSGSVLTNNVQGMNNDFTGLPDDVYVAGQGFNMATGLGSPTGADLLTMQPVDGCPSVTSVSPVSGQAGSSVTIGGPGHEGASSVHFGSVAATDVAYDAANGTVTATAPAGVSGTVDVTITNPNGTSAVVTADRFSFGAPRPAPTVSSVTPAYGWLAGGTHVTITGSGFDGSTSVLFGGVPASSFTVQSSTSIAAVAPAAPDGPNVVHVSVVTPEGTSASQAVSLFAWDDQSAGEEYFHGFWVAAADGGVFAYGDAQFFGSAGGLHLNKPVVGMAVTPDQGGYWLVASDGGIFAYGDAGFYGSTGSLHLNEPIVGMAATPDGKGYWLVASDGGIFAYGDAGFYGSTGSLHLNKPIVGMAATSTGNGYWLVASDGGVFAFGAAPFYGSMGGHPLNQPIAGIVASTYPTPDSGYWMYAGDGGVFAFGGAWFGGPFVLSALGSVVAASPIPGGSGLLGLYSSGAGVIDGPAIATTCHWGTAPSNAPVVGIAAEGSPWADG
ncbi:MAG: protease pro-enzyme activation domain-containing protein [Acidimicrobiales bacterium]